ncbi:MAG: tryptophan--tRNA ligase [Hydrogenoanaerobacterium sp.]
MLEDSLHIKAERKKKIFSGIQPTGIMTLGNYLGAVKNWVQLQNDYDCTYCIVDMHAITVKQEPKLLRQHTLEAYALMLACGVDPAKSTAFVQSHVPAHAELSWALSCCTQFGELSRMTQFKDKSKRYPENINAGLFTYPVLMVADILLYHADLVPVGVDQKQHLELTRDVAIRFNNTYGNTFTVPEPYIPTQAQGSKIMSLADPTKKMSKSDDNINGFISILDKPEVIVKKFKRAVTDSDSQVAYRKGKDGINNLITIYAAVTGESFENIEHDFDGRGYGDFKAAVGEAVAEHLRPVRESYEKLLADKAYLEGCYKSGAESAKVTSGRTLEKVYKKIGFLPSN